VEFLHEHMAIFRRGVVPVLYEISKNNGPNSK